LDLFRLIFQLFNQSSFIGFSGLKGEFEQCDYIDGYLQSKITYDEIIVIFDSALRIIKSSPSAGALVAQSGHIIECEKIIS